jgi:hypothetical protein
MTPRTKPSAFSQFVRMRIDTEAHRLGLDATEISGPISAWDSRGDLRTQWARLRDGRARLRAADPADRPAILRAIARPYDE